jgi:hypothetical protein
MQRLPSMSWLNRFRIGTPDLPKERLNGIDDERRCTSPRMQCRWPRALPLPSATLDAIAGRAFPLPRQGTELIVGPNGPRQYEMVHITGCNFCRATISRASKPKGVGGWTKGAPGGRRGSGSGEQINFACARRAGFRRLGGVIAARLKPLPILVSILPADSLQSGRT